MSLNRYVYGRDNPEKYSDTSGHAYFTAGSVTNTQSVCQADPGACSYAYQGNSGYRTDELIQINAQVHSYKPPPPVVIDTNVAQPSTSAISTSSPSCTMATVFCNIENYGGTNVAEKITGGGTLIFVGVYVGFTTGGLASVPYGGALAPAPSSGSGFLPPGIGPWYASPDGWAAEGSMLLFSGTAQLGTDFGNWIKSI